MRLAVPEIIDQRLSNVVLHVVLLAVLLAPLVGCGSTRSGRPRVYDDDRIERVAVLSVGHDTITDYVTEGLVYNSRWRVIDRISLDRILKEQNLSNTQRFDSSTAARLGRLLGVDLVVFGDYQGERVVIKGILVETGQVVVYRNIEIAGGEELRFKAYLCLTALLPYRIEYSMSGHPSRVMVGDTLDDT